MAIYLTMRDCIEAMREIELGTAWAPWRVQAFVSIKSGSSCYYKRESEWISRWTVDRDHPIIERRYTVCAVGAPLLLRGIEIPHDFQGISIRDLAVGDSPLITFSKEPSIGEYAGSPIKTVADLQEVHDAACVPWAGDPGYLCYADQVRIFLRELVGLEPV